LHNTVVIHFQLIMFIRSNTALMKVFCAEEKHAMVLPGWLS
jgi:hypothetical protein